MKETLKQFNDRTERETWNGLATAYRNGARCRLEGKDGNYNFRQDFADAWRRGWDAMDRFLTVEKEEKLSASVKVTELIAGRSPQPLKYEDSPWMRELNRKIALQMFAAESIRKLGVTDTEMHWLRENGMVEWTS